MSLCVWVLLSLCLSVSRFLVFPDLRRNVSLLYDAEVNQSRLLLSFQPSAPLVEPIRNKDISGSDLDSKAGVTQFTELFSLLQGSVICGDNWIKMKVRQREIERQKNREKERQRGRALFCSL